MISASAVLLLSLYLSVHGLTSSDCTRTDAAFATASDGMSALGGWTALVPTASASAGASGIAIAAAPSQLSGIVGKGSLGAWIPPFDVQFTVQVADMPDPSGIGSGSLGGSFMLVDAQGTPDVVHAAAGCDQFSFSFDGTATTSSRLVCCGDGCQVAKFKSGSTSEESGPDQEYVGVSFGRQSMQLRDSPKASDLNQWTIRVTNTSVEMLWRTISHVMVRDGTTGEWPGDDLPGGLRPAFVMPLGQDSGKSPRLLVQGLAIAGCSIGATQSSTPTSTPPASTPLPSQPAQSSPVPLSTATPTPPPISTPSGQPLPSSGAKKTVIIDSPTASAMPRPRYCATAVLIALSLSFLCAM